jgi:hypothetical protein
MLYRQQLFTRIITSQIHQRIFPLQKTAKKPKYQKIRRFFINGKKLRAGKRTLLIFLPVGIHIQKQTSHNKVCKEIGAAVA